MMTGENMQENPLFGATEVPFLSGMERNPGRPEPATPEAPTDTTLLRFRLDALNEKVEQIRVKSGEVAATAMRAVKAAMQMVGLHSVTDRGPHDFDPEEDTADRLADRVARIIARRYGPTRHTTYTNGDAGGGNGEKRLLKWILGIVGSLFVLATVGGITLYGEVSALKATVTTGMNAHEQRINRVEQRLDRTSPNAP